MFLNSRHCHYSLAPLVSFLMTCCHCLQDSIKASQSWFMACAPYAAGMAYMIANRAANTTDFDKNLHLVYLANDILFKAHTQQSAAAAAEGQQQQQQAMSVEVATAFAPALGVMLGAAKAAAGSSGNEAGVDKLNKMLSFWQEKGLFDAATVSRLREEMSTADPQAALLANYPPKPAAAEAPAAPPPAAAAPTGWGPPGPGAAAPGYAPPGGSAAVTGWGGASGGTAAASVPPPHAPAGTPPAAAAGAAWGQPDAQLHQQQQQQQQHMGGPAGDAAVLADKPRGFFDLMSACLLSCF
jgi:hypothetical protein